MPTEPTPPPNAMRLPDAPKPSHAAMRLPDEPTSLHVDPCSLTASLAQRNDARPRVRVHHMLRQRGSCALSTGSSTSYGSDAELRGIFGGQP